MESQRADHVPEWVSKLELARRQLSAAIRLSFEQRDAYCGPHAGGSRASGPCRPRKHQGHR